MCVFFAPGSWRQYSQLISSFCTGRDIVGFLRNLVDEGNLAEVGIFMKRGNGEQKELSNLNTNTTPHPQRLTDNLHADTEPYSLRCLSFTAMHWPRHKVIGPGRRMAPMRSTRTTTRVCLSWSRGHLNPLPRGGGGGSCPQTFPLTEAVPHRPPIPPFG